MNLNDKFKQNISKFRLLILLVSTLLIFIIFLNYNSGFKKKSSNYDENMKLQKEKNLLDKENRLREITKSVYNIEKKIKAIFTLEDQESLKKLQGNEIQKSQEITKIIIFLSQKINIESIQNKLEIIENLKSNDPKQKNLGKTKILEYLEQVKNKDNVNKLFTSKLEDIIINLNSPDQQIVEDELSKIILQTEQYLSKQMKEKDYLRIQNLRNPSTLDSEIEKIIQELKYKEQQALNNLSPEERENLNKLKDEQESLRSEIEIIKNK
ncbi:hypothetical protein [Candidatus Phytoplasma oryzae]|nr:hypothetical protein PIE28_00695 [Candidatus Phytoplasma oryzae]